MVLFFGLCRKVHYVDIILGSAAELLQKFKALPGSRCGIQGAQVLILEPWCWGVICLVGLISFSLVLQAFLDGMLNNWAGNSQCVAELKVSVVPSGCAAGSCGQLIGSVLDLGLSLLQGPCKRSTTYGSLLRYVWQVGSRHSLGS